MVSTTDLTVAGILGPGGAIAQRTPGYEHREPQLTMADAVSKSLVDREHLVAEAGTGTGKSFAYLIPAILSGKRVIVSTAVKALQEQLMQKDLPFLKELFDELERPFTYASLKGVSNYLCRAKLAEVEAEGVARSNTTLIALQDIYNWAETTLTGDIEESVSPITSEMRGDVTASSEECTGKACPFAGQCFSRGAKERAKGARVVVVNHALLMVDALMRQQGFGVVPDHDVVVIDEAHQLEEAAQNAFAVETSEARWQRIATRIKKMTGAADELLDAITLQVRALFADYQSQARDGDGGSVLRIGDDSVRGRRIYELINDAVTTVVQRSPSLMFDGEGETKLSKMTDAAATFGIDLLACLTPSTQREIVRYVKVEDRRVVLVRVPVDVSDELRDLLFTRMNDRGQRVPIVSTSATIADLGRRMEFWRSRVGMESGRELLAESPFDYHQNALLYIPYGLEAPAYGDRAAESRYYDRMADEMERLAYAANGRTFLLFTSRKAMNAVYDRIGRGLQCKYLVLKQGDAPNGLLVHQFKSDGRAVLFGLKSFWEGVSVEGDALSLVAIDKMPFAPPGDPLWDAKCDLVNRQYGDKWAWFNRLALPTATIALKQGFGRLIRTQRDRGVVAILDSRLRSKNYGRRVIDSLPPARQCDEFDCVESFFGGKEVGQSRFF